MPPRAPRPYRTDAMTSSFFRPSPSPQARAAREPARAPNRELETSSPVCRLQGNKIH